MSLSLERSIWVWQRRDGGCNGSRGWSSAKCFNEATHLSKCEHPLGPALTTYTAMFLSLLPTANLRIGTNSQRMRERQMCLIPPSKPAFAAQTRRLVTIRRGREGGMVVWRSMLLEVEALLCQQRKLSTERMSANDTCIWIGQPNQKPISSYLPSCVRSDTRDIE